MSRTERVQQALAAGCAVSIDVKEFPPGDLLALARVAQGKGIPITFRNSSEKDPTTMLGLAQIGAASPGLFTFWF